MKLIVISNPINVNKEHTLLCSLFENGLEYFHLRKPDFTSDEMEAYIKQIPAEYLNKIIVHSHHHLVDKYHLKGKYKTSANIREIRVGQLLADKADERRIENFISTSFHSTDEIMACDCNYEYAFLSPIFDSISKKGYTSKFNQTELKFFLSAHDKKMELIALGGINEETIHQAIDLGFDGVAVLGAIWNSKNAMNSFLFLQRKTNEISNDSKFATIKR
jgi:thiamine-phosphate pyrophosphorylase